MVKKTSTKTNKSKAVKPRKFDSGFEKDIYEQLIKLSKKIKYHPCSLQYTLHCKYTPDFELPNGILIETKGYHRNFVARCRAIAAAIKQNPVSDIRFVWQNDLKWTGTKMRVSDWCRKQGIKYAIGSVPEEWLDE